MNHITDLAALKKPLPDALLATLNTLFGERFSTTMAMREHHGRDASSYDPMLPDAVVFVESTEEVAALVKLCGEYEIPVIPFGSGTSLEGHVLALQGGISIDMSRMNRLLAIHAEDLTATVQAGVTATAEPRDQDRLVLSIDPGAAARSAACITRLRHQRGALRQHARGAR